jgi:hypothetical protein
MRGDARVVVAVYTLPTWLPVVVCVAHAVVPPFPISVVPTRSRGHAELPPHPVADGAAENIFAVPL